MVRRLLIFLTSLLFLFFLPFWVLIRGAVFFHEQYQLTAWGALSGGILCSGVLLLLYLVYFQGRLYGRAGDVRRTYGLALGIVLVYCLPALFYLSTANAKYEEVRREFTDLHPILRLGISTLTFLDHDLLITDANRQPEDYAQMGLAVNQRSLHYRQSSGYAHAVDVRTIGRGPVRNALVAGYFRLMGFRTLRHSGTADHLHVSISSRDRPGGI